MNRKIDWVAVHPITHNDEGSRTSAGESFKRDVSVLGEEAERNHAKLSDHVYRLNALRRGDN